MSEIPENKFETEPLPEVADVLEQQVVTEPTVAEQPVDLNANPESEDFDELRINNDQAPAPVAEKRKPVRPYTPEIYHPNVVLTEDRDLKRNPHLKDPGIMLAPSTPSDINNIIAAIDGDTVKHDAEFRDWLATLDEATMNSMPSNLLMRAQSREGSRWAQELRGNQYFIKPAWKSVSKRDVQQSMSGNIAVDLFIQGANMGRTVRWPLYRSGIWINIRPASLTYLAEIDRSLSFDRAQIGLDTAGLFNSNDSLIFDDKLVDAALRLVTYCNVQVNSVMDLRNIIAKADIPSLIAAMAAATFADGAGASVTCTDHKCRNSDMFDMDLRRMSWVDTSRFSPEQIALMDEPDVVHTLDQVREYQAGFARDEEGKYEFKGRTFHFHNGSAGEYFELGHQWIAQINRALSEALGEAEIDNGKRARVVQSILTAETLCRYAHYIKSITVPSKDVDQNDIIVTIDDPNTIRDILKMLIADDDGSDGLFAAIEDYIVQTEITIFGYLNYACTKCGNYHLDDRGEARLIIPFKVGTAFFTLLQHRLLKQGIAPLTDLETSGIRAFLQVVLAHEYRQLSIQQSQMASLMEPSA